MEKCSPFAAAEGLEAVAVRLVERGCGANRCPLSLGLIIERLLRMETQWRHLLDCPLSTTLSARRRGMLWELEAMPCGHHQHPQPDFKTNDFPLPCRLGTGPAAAAPPSPALDHREQKHPHPEDEEEGGNVEGDWCPLWVLTLHSKEVVLFLTTSDQPVRSWSDQGSDS